MNPADLMIVLVPAALGRIALAAARLERPGLAECLGQSWLLGCAALSTMLVLLGRAAAPLTAGTMLAGSLALALTLAAVALRRKTGGVTSFVGPTPSASFARGALPRAAFAILLGLIAVRAAWIVADSRIAPELFNDAYENWLLRARVIAERGRLPLDPADPYHLGGGRTGYPLGMPMLAAFAARLSGGWDERAVGIIWPVYWMALLAVVGGWVARRCGGLFGCAAAYALSGPPLPALHAARPGYADLLLGAHLTAACLAAWDHRAGRGGAAAVCAANLLFCVLLKREGLAYFALILAPVVLTELLRMLQAMSLYAGAAGASVRSAGGASFVTRVSRLAAFALLLSAAAIGLAALSDLAFVRREAAGIGLYPAALAAMRARLFTWDSWGLLWWLLAPGLPWATVRLVRGGMGLAALHAWLLIAFVGGVFLCTANWAFAVNGWTFDRTVLHVAPVIVCTVTLAVAMPRRVTAPSHAASG